MLNERHECEHRRCAAVHHPQCCQLPRALCLHGGRTGNGATSKGELLDTPPWEPSCLESKQSIGGGSRQPTTDNRQPTELINFVFEFY